MIVELIGVPGSGKTEATLRALDLLAARGINCVGYEELERYRTERGDRYLNRCNLVARLFHFATLYRRYPAVVLRVRWLALRHGAIGRKRWRKARRPLANLLMALRLESEFPGRVVILDDGFLQKLWSMLIGAASLRGLAHVEALLAEYYAATGVRCIRLDIPDDLAVERAFARDSKGRFNRDAGAKIRTEFGAWLGHHRACMERMPRGAVVARIDGSQPPDLVAAAVVDCVAHLCQASTSASSGAS